jgi:hypothetical protein
MANWICVRCGWDNAGAWEKCAKCGLEKISREDLHLFEEAEKEFNQVRAQIEQHRVSLVAKWEYLVLHTGMDADKKWKVRYQGELRPYENLFDILHELGNHGWELISISTSVGSEKPFFSTYTFTFTSGEEFYFKRPYNDIPERLQKQLDKISAGIPENLRGKLNFPR